MKKLIAFATTLSALALSACGGGNDGSDPKTIYPQMKVNDMTLNYYEEYEGYAVEDYYGNETKVSIPDTVTVDGKSIPVVRISPYGLQARAGKTPLKIVELGRNLVSIGKSAFQGTELEELYVSRYLSDVDPEAFEGCPYKGVQEKGLIYIPSRTNQHCVLFGGEYDDWSYEFPADCHSILCTALTGINFGTLLDLSNVYFVGDGAFENCEATTVRFGENIVGIGKETFKDAKISDVQFDNSVNCKTVGDRAFYNSTVRFINFPASIKTMGENFLGNCEELRTLELPFVGKDEDTPKTYKSYCNTSFLDTEFDSLTIDRGTIAASSFIDSRIANLYLNHVKHVELDAFRNAGITDTLSLGDSLISVKDNGFYNFWASEVYIPSTIQSVGSYAFYTDAATTIDVGVSEFTPGTNFEYRWYNETGATVVNWGKAHDQSQELTPVDDFEYYLSGDRFYITKYTGNSTSVTVPEEISGNKFAGIQSDAFGDSNAANIKSITTPTGSIQAHAFSNCSSLQELNLNVIDGYSSIYSAWDWFAKGEKAGFYQDKYTTFSEYDTIYVDGYVPSSLKTLRLSLLTENGMITISAATFYGFKSLTLLELDGPASFGAQCFGGCPNLKGNIYIYDSTTFGSSCFGNANINLYFESSENIDRRSTSSGGYTNFSLNLVASADIGSELHTDSATNLQYRDDKRRADRVVIAGYAGSASSVVVPETLGGKTVSRVAGTAFSGTSIRELTFSSSVAFESKCFQGASSLQSISLQKFPKAYNYMGNEITFDDGYSKLNAFYALFTFSTDAVSGSYKIPDVNYYIPNSLTTLSFATGDIPAGALRGFLKLTRVFLPHDCTSIAYKAFYGCQGLKDMWIPSTCTSFGDRSFESTGSIIVYKEAKDTNLGWGNDTAKANMKTGYTYELYCQEVGI